jgi:hypothetical protein
MILFLVALVALIGAPIIVEVGKGERYVFGLDWCACDPFMTCRCASKHSWLQMSVGFTHQRALTWRVCDLWEGRARSGFWKGSGLVEFGGIAG